MSSRSSRHSPCTSYESYSHSHYQSSSLSSGHISGSTSDEQSSDGCSNSNSLHSRTKSSRESFDAAEAAHDSSCDSTTHIRSRSQFQRAPLVPSPPSSTSTSSSSSIVLLCRVRTSTLASSGSHHKAHVAVVPDMPPYVHALDYSTAWRFVQVYAHEFGFQVDFETGPSPRVKRELQTTVLIGGCPVGVGFGWSEGSALRDAKAHAATYLLEADPQLRRLLPREVQECENEWHASLTHSRDVVKEVRRPAGLPPRICTTMPWQPSATTSSSLPPPSRHSTKEVPQAQARTSGDGAPRRSTPQDDPALGTYSSWVPHPAWSKGASSISRHPADPPPRDRTMMSWRASATDSSSLLSPALPTTGKAPTARICTSNDGVHCTSTLKTEPTLARVRTCGPRAPYPARMIEESSCPTPARQAAHENARARARTVDYLVPACTPTAEAMVEVESRGGASHAPATASTVKSSSCLTSAHPAAHQASHAQFWTSDLPANIPCTRTTPSSLSSISNRSSSSAPACQTTDKAAQLQARDSRLARTAVLSGAAPVDPEMPLLRSSVSRCDAFARSDRSPCFHFRTPEA
jgi:hypothetical protein